MDQPKYRGKSLQKFELGGLYGMTWRTIKNRLEPFKATLSPRIFDKTTNLLPFEVEQIVNLLGPFE